MLGKLQKALPTLRGHFAPAYLVGSNKLIGLTSVSNNRIEQGCYYLLYDNEIR